ncbi:rod shape-determining protein MreC [Lusitaniella coriacea LEGE 07157]|uniref:Cell shape-determining protein MreC n=1 Tax=Lusitaniella coriacea LEGE 07157 TaxID=945747 RepID=A0A8J7DXP1_9CYAN|nr:rod shape-determining protein MreC [Lusitaniella coriacea]MBE9116930.1 rod shape-determining protein MreC [Lusitaniella coriacea LEGE 07157]
MFIVRRWWERYGVQVFFSVVVLGTAIFLRQTQGVVLSEIYYWVFRPLQPNELPEKQLTDARVEELQAKLSELEQQNETLKGLLDYVEGQKLEGVVAPIVGRSVDHWWQQVTLGRGSQDGIKIDDVVTGPGGLVGRITQVTPNTSRVLLSSDPNSRVGAMIGRSRQMGSMRGDGSDRAVMEFFEKVPDVKKGDKVLTSTVSRLFPPGIPVGYVESVDLEKSPAPEVIVKLSAPMDYLEWVVVHPFKSK